MVNDDLARMTCIHAEFPCQKVAVVDNTTLQGAFCLTYASTVVRHRAGCKGMALQNVKCGHPGFVFAHAGIIKNTENGSCCQRILRRTDAAVRAADRNAARVMRLELGDGIN